MDVVNRNQERWGPLLIGFLGTAAYMSPEQAKGKPVDKRADIWAFGAVLFEMLAGVAAFGGSDITEVLAAVSDEGSGLGEIAA